jgi:hypothetical protein
MSKEVPGEIEAQKDRLSDSDHMGKMICPRSCGRPVSSTSESSLGLSNNEKTRRPAPGIQTGRQTLHGAMYVSGFIRLRRTRSLKAEPPPAYTGFAENVLRTIRWSSCLL